MDNVIVFPRLRSAGSNQLGRVTAALCLIGEPAMASELSALLLAAGLDNSQDLTPAAITLMLVQHGPEAEAGRLFQRVTVGGEEAWALTRDYRTLLREAGIAPPLRQSVGGDQRPLPDLIAARGLHPGGGALQKAADDQEPPMIPEDDDFDADGGGFDVDDWTRLAAFTGAVATLDDVQARRAVFALGDTTDPKVLEMELPQPVIWWEDDGEQAAVAVQAETHVNADGESMEILGLILPDGDAAVALLEDCDLVDDTDPTWRDLVARAVDGGED